MESVSNHANLQSQEMLYYQKTTCTFALVILALFCSSFLAVTNSPSVLLPSQLSGRLITSLNLMSLLFSLESNYNMETPLQVVKFSYNHAIIVHHLIHVINVVNFAYPSTS